ncbi:MAG TPA: ATP-binding protein [Dongiaceae bacterium]|jgi:two-component system nitrogen regulation sensor histidine kinase GlnL
MGRPQSFLRLHSPADAEAAERPDGMALLNALPTAVFVVGEDLGFLLANPAAEQFFGLSATALTRRRLDDVAGADSPLVLLLQQAREHDNSLSEHEVALELPRLGRRLVGISVAPVSEWPGRYIVNIHERTIASKIDRHLNQRDATRTVTSMAGMLAHEIRNPLSGIRGAAQLLEANLPPADRELTKLIRDETDRVVGILDRIDIFADDRPIGRAPVNIHEVLDHVRKVAQAGFGRERRFVERYDPSLPPVLGHRDLLIQLFLNLVKNAAEATENKAGTIVLGTAYQHGVRVQAPGGQHRVDLPLCITIEDNGKGIPEEHLPRLFEPFFTTKLEGKGLGLALVAKIVRDHDGIIECRSAGRRTQFDVRLPLAATADGEG